MCSFFGAGEKIEAKIEDLVKKFEDRFADIEDKVCDELTPKRYLIFYINLYFSKTATMNQTRKSSIFLKIKSRN